jgi:hypothetical protein
MKGRDDAPRNAAKLCINGVDRAWRRVGVAGEHGHCFDKEKKQSFDKLRTNGC